MEKLYNLHEPWKTLDPWQKEVIEADGNVAVRSGRQCGKSTAIAIKAGEYAIKNKRSQILVISAVERQAFLLFEKILSYIDMRYPRYVKKGANRPTKSIIRLRNGSVIRCLPTGLSGRGIRGFTINLLIADEAAFIPEEVWSAVTPMIAITRGKIILLSTPFGRAGYFYKCFDDDTFTKFHVSSEDNPRRDEEFLKQEQKRMTKLQWAQEYLGEFVDDLRQLFPDNLIKEVMCLRRREQPIAPPHDFFLGVDIARMGKDESTFEILDITNKERIEQVENIITKKTLITDTIQEIIGLNRIYDFKKIYIDDGGLGVGVFDHLLQEEETRRKVVAINNASRSLDRDKRRKKLLKEDLYMNLLRLMERREIKLLDDDEIFLSLKSIQYEYTGIKEEEGKEGKGLKIFGNYTHITEGLIRAAWAVRDKSLNIYIY